MPPRQPARYTITHGLAGCYMPDSDSGALVFATRSELAEQIKCDLAFHGMPASLFNEVRIRKLWSYIQRHGSSVAHFSLTHKGYSLSFHGLTEAEFNADEGE